MDRKERIKYLQMINRRRLLLREMQKHINEIELDEAENGCRIILVSKNLQFGLCLWKSEYDFQLYKWEDLGKC